MDTITYNCYKDLGRKITIRDYMRYAKYYRRNINAYKRGKELHSKIKTWIT